MKTEKEKMIASEYYLANDSELSYERKTVQNELVKINAELDTDKRSQFLKNILGKTGTNLTIMPSIKFDYGYNIFLGENFFANYNNIFLDVCPIHIGNNCLFGPNVQLYTASHPLDPVERNSGKEFGKPITIGDNVWIGGGSIILAGVSLGKNLVVAAGAVVTKSFPDNVIIGGNPAKILKKIKLSAQ